jgi:plasmid stability protein
MTKSITIRHVPGEIRDELAARAARSGQSLQEYLHAQLCALASSPDPQRMLEAIRERKRVTGARLDAARILELRDSDRR